MVSAVVVKSDGKSGEWRLYLHHDHTAELWHRTTPGKAAQSVVRRNPLYQVRLYLREHGIGEDGWSPD